jgi:Putative transposase
LDFREAVNSAPDWVVKSNLNSSPPRLSIGGGGRSSGTRPSRRRTWRSFARSSLKVKAASSGATSTLTRRHAAHGYTHRVAISNRRLIAADAKAVTFKVKDYRIDGPGRYKTMTLDANEFIRRFLIHVLPKGFHRIRHTRLILLAISS